jgi:branched-chain amino acid transport system permease protein
MVMVGGYVGWWALATHGLNPVVALVLAFVFTFGLGTATELVSVQPLISRRNDVDFELVTFITTFAVAIFLTNVALQHFGPFQQNVPTIVGGNLKLYHGVSISYHELTMAAIAVVLMAGLGLFLAHTRWGLAVRAVAQDLDAARSLAVPVTRLYPLTMGLASALAGVGGVFLGALYFASPTAGDLPLLFALIVVVLGGLGSLTGTLYAAYLVGMTQSFCEVEIGTTWTLPILYGAILVILVFRPYGLKGSPSEARL